MKEPNENISYDVAICGGGLSGLAASILLSRSGLQVVCIEPKPYPHHKVGESFDWSTPDLLKSIGLDPQEIVKSGFAIPKDHIRIIASDGKVAVGGPKEWMGKKPWNLETVTIHGDRKEIDRLLYELAVKQGVTFINESVKSIERQSEKIDSFITNSNLKINADWFVDASGSAQIIGRKLELPKLEFGPLKVSMWTSFPSASLQHGTSLFGNKQDRYLTWLWKIPIRPDRVSLGCVMPAEKVKKKIKAGEKIESIYLEELQRYPNVFEGISGIKNDPIRTCRYTPYVYQKVHGPNWIMIGEAAAMHDALSSNGVTNGLRHAHDVARIIGKAYRQKGKVATDLKCYNSKVFWMARVFNAGIEKVVYEAPIRRLAGIEFVGRLYAKLALPINAIYSKLQPHTNFRMLIMKMFILIVLAWWGTFQILGKSIYSIRRLFIDKGKDGSQNPLPPLIKKT